MKTDIFITQGVIKKIDLPSIIDIYTTETYKYALAKAKEEAVEFEDQWEMRIVMAPTMPDMHEGFDKDRKIILKDGLYSIDLPEWEVVEEINGYEPDTSYPAREIPTYRKLIRFTKQ